ncbi:MAG: hypothetical protein FJX76_03645 [Armatimonadetes bacterium]|nr:hypothetical protein [Armatimonadota bacterium]
MLEFLARTIAEGACAACGESLPRGAAACHACGAAQAGEEPGVNFLAGPATPGERAGNLQRLQDSLEAVQEGHAAVSHALEVADAIAQKFERWWVDLNSFDCDDFHSEEEIGMQRDYLAVCGGLRNELQSYREALQYGDITTAAVRMYPLEEGFARLKSLKDHYAELGY